jgi:hypothetical protein
MASKIDRGQAKSLIQEFRTQNQASGDHAWKTPDGQHLHGFFIDRGSLEKILSDKENAGIHVYFAKHPDFAGKQDKVHTIVYTGSKPNTESGAVTPYVSNGDYFDNSPPCPPNCTTV